MGEHPALVFFAFVIPFAYLWDDAWVVHRTLHSEERMNALKKIEDEAEAKSFVYGGYRKEIKIGLCIIAYFSILVIYFATAQ